MRLKSAPFLSILLIFLPLLGRAQLSEGFFESLSTPWMEVLEGGGPNPARSSYPWWFRPIQQEWLKFEPKGKRQFLSDKCDIKKWQDTFLKRDFSFKEQAQAIREYTENCRGEIETGHNGPVVNTLGTLFLRFEPREYGFGRHVMFHFKNGLKLKGYLALKDDHTRRPFILFRAGIFSNTEEFIPERSIFFQMFQQSGFNMLILESLSGSDFTKNNEAFAFGGFDEGLQNYIIAQRLLEPEEPLSRLVSSVHTMGLSMGGHGTMFANILNQLNAPKGRTLISSSLALCPLLNFRDTLDFHTSQGFSLSAMNYWAYSRLSEIRKRFPELKEDKFIPDLLKLIETRYKEPLLGLETGLKFPWDIRQALVEHDQRIFWELNNFWPFYKAVMTPALIFATLKDPIVPWPINSGRIFEGRMSFKDSQVELVPLFQAYHCSFPVAYDWDVMTTIFQSYILKNSPEYQPELKTFSYPMDEKLLKAVKQGYKVLNLDYKIDKGTALLSVRVKFQKEPRPSWLDRLFIKKRQFEIPLEQFDYQIRGNLERPEDILSLVRWANHNIQSKIENNNLILTWPRTPGL